MSKTTNELAAELTIAMLEHNGKLSYDIGDTAGSTSEPVTAKQIAESFLFLRSAVLTGKIDKQEDDVQED